MAQVDVERAKAELPSLLDRAQAGEEIVIARDGRSVARLVPCAEPGGKRKFGAMKGELVVPDDFFDPLPDDELDLWEGKG